jgi:hypothetical protein
MLKKLLYAVLILALWWICERSANAQEPDGRVATQIVEGPLQGAVEATEVNGRIEAMQSVYAAIEKWRAAMLIRHGTVELREDRRRNIIRKEREQLADMIEQMRRFIAEQEQYTRGK